MKHNKGFSSLEFLITLFFLSLILIALGLFLRTADLTVKKHTANKNDKEIVDSVLTDIFNEIKNDSTPAADSDFDPVWKYNETEINGFHIRIRSLSSLLNLNFIEKDILLKTGLNKFFKSVDEIENLKNMIYNEGLVYSYEKLSDYITEENFNSTFTLYGYANYNVSEELPLKLFINDLTQSAYGDELINKRKAMKFNKQLVQNETELQMLCGIHYDDIFPYVNLNPSLNVNFMSEDCLKALLSYSGFNLSNATQKINNLIELRNNKEISQEELYEVLGISKSNELYYYLGCKTWMWQICLDNQRTSCSVVLARSPVENASGKTDIYLIEKKWK